MTLARCVVIVVACSLAGCNPELELPEPPDVTARAARYENPTTDLSIDTAEQILQTYLDAREQIAELGDLGPLTRAVIDFDRELDAGSDGQGGLELAGVPVTTDAVVTLVGDCPGWPSLDEPPIRDAFAFTAVIRRSTLVPTLWGSINSCKLEVTRESVTARVAFSGDVTAYLPNLLDATAGDDAPLIAFVAFSLRDIHIAGETRAALDGDFRLVGERLEILVRILDGTVIPFATTDPAPGIGVRAANGTWVCYPEERRCDAIEASDPSFSY